MAVFKESENEFILKWLGRIEKTIHFSWKFGLGFAVGLFTMWVING